ncbi:LANO_0E11232g1_1 [Lachancea nothofagi CBS 11611]|uniref:Ribosome assembly protein 3 n=1 Tax=Lachancea nothofagi CBS 11611 TaxID=1266666 RepID=A0A1G4JXE2_9SACH|nr:LANO_0E11232g1_1 [Lachancea nothofagi CBS 11611]
MAVTDNNLAKVASRKTRRSKKRRTAEVSDSDSSSSSSSSDAESEKENNEGSAINGASESQPMEEHSDLEISEEGVMEDIKLDDDETLGDATRQILNDIPLTSTELSENPRKNINNIDLSQIQQTLQEAQNKVSSTKDEGQLKNSYLSVVFKHYGEDVNSLREAPDFTPKSLVLLANVLKDGGHMFDIDTLRTVVESEL